MASTASGVGSTHSLREGPVLPGNATNGGMDELLPLVMQLTNAEQVRALDTCEDSWRSFWFKVIVPRNFFEWKPPR
jgi:hypothetical protein